MRQKVLVDTPRSRSARRRAAKKKRENTIEQSTVRIGATAVIKKQKKQNAKGNQIKPDRLLQIPLSVFVQIASYLWPQDVLYLARTAKRWRKLLISRSSAYIWRTAIGNVEDLPPCPDTMSEPRYTALVFTLLCTMCQHKITTDFDTLYANLLVRLCNNCQRTSLIKWRDIPYEDVRELVARSKRGMFGLFSLLSEAEGVLEQILELEEADDDDEAMDEWVLERQTLLRKRYEYGRQLARFVAAQQTNHEEAREIGRHYEIKRRLKVLGWSDDDMVFPKETERIWLEYLNHRCPLTDCHWEKIRPALENLLETNIRERPVKQKLERQKVRCDHLKSTWDTIKTDMARPAEADVVPQTLTEAISKVVLLNPIPEFSDAVNWPTIKALIEAELSIPELHDLFVQQRAEMDKDASEWSTRIKTCLAGVFRQNLDQNQCLVGLPIVGNIDQNQHQDPFADLSPDLQILIRADSLFAVDRSGYLVPPISCYDDYVKAIRHSVYGWHERIYDPLDITRFQCHAKASTVARALLECLGRPINTSILELRLLDERFSCGRCDDNKPKSWLQAVEHYTKEEATWNVFKTNYQRHFDNMSVVIRNIHDLKSSRKPLVNLLTPGELSVPDAGPATLGGINQPLFKCGFCLDKYDWHKPKTESQILNHLRDFHAIPEPRIGEPPVEVWQATNS